MIIQLLGANGAGKSTIVQEIMGLRTRVPMYLWGRRVPDYYVLQDVTVVGHYEGSACGGGDTLPRDRVEETLHRIVRSSGRPVLLEGPTGREPMILTGDPRVIYIKKPAQACLGNWINRQHQKGLDANVPVMERRVASVIRRVERMVDEYQSRDHSVRTFTKRPQVTEYIEQLLGRK